ncbi:MAG: hypothetical protein JWL69_299 [Phycisphaerales bacterium]|nr:hypothetical protein [Phycisphaerales bacterium]
MGRSWVIFFTAVLILLTGNSHAVDKPATGNDSKPVSPLKDSPLAQQAESKYEQDVAAAKKDYETKVALLRQDMEKKIEVSRKICAASLKTAQTDATRTNKLDLAVAIKHAADEASAPLSFSWPDILPVGSTATSPADKPVIKPTKKVVSFADEKKLRESISPTGDWRMENGGLRLGRKTKLESSDEFTGNFELRCTCSLNRIDVGMSVVMWGEEFLMPDGKSDGFILRREGNKLSFVTKRGSEQTVTMKDEWVQKPSTFVIQTGSSVMSGQQWDCLIHSMSISGQRAGKN